MERKHVPDSEQKLVILYALHRLGPVTGIQLLQFLVEEDLMNYFIMQLNLCELQEQGQIAERPHPFGTLLEVTEAGEFTLESFDQRIPASRREQIDSICGVWRGLFLTEQQTLAESFPFSDGGLCVRLRLLEGETTLVDLLVTLPGVSHITQLTQRWRAGAQEIYSAISQLLGSGYSEEQSDSQPLSANASMQQLSERDWMLSLTGDMSSMQVTLMLTLPGDGLARHYASRWEEHCTGLMDMVRKMLVEERE